MKEKAEKWWLYTNTYVGMWMTALVTSCCRNAGVLLKLGVQGSLGE